MHGIERFEWLSRMDEGVFLVHLASKEGNLHAIVLDAARKIVHDPQEKHSLRLCSEVLRLCAGGTRPEVRSVRLVVPE